jgi:hypothetical protein
MRWESETAHRELIGDRTQKLTPEMIALDLRRVQDWQARDQHVS